MGDLLGVDPNTIETLCYSSFPDDVKMSKMLQSWLDNEPTPATWDNIINVIKGPLQKKSLAIKICQFLGTTLGMQSLSYCHNSKYMNMII